MGISGLLPLLKSIHKPCHLRKFAGQTLGVDAFGWLHRGAVACAVELALDKPTTRYVDFAMNRVRMMIHFGVTPYLVFDGDSLPSKSGTNKARRKSRKESKEEGIKLLQAGKPAQAQFELQKSVDVTAEMVGLLISELKKAGVKFIVAPYEADSQLAYLEKKGIIQGILSEDSDLLVFGARCLLTKLDQFGECVMIRRDDFTACREVSLVGWTDADFRRMAVLSGCDYLPSIGGMGLKTAYRMLRKHKTAERVIRTLQFDGKFKVPIDYMKDFEQAELSFIYPWVYCPLDRGLVTLSPPEDGIIATDLPYIGAYIEPEVAQQVAAGLLHPRSKEPLVIPIIPQRTRQSMPGPAAKKAAAAATKPDIKRNNSIDSFFRPRRIPLAELDPNCFAQTPSQQQTLQQAVGASWPATPSPTMHLQRSVSTSTRIPARRSTSEIFMRTPSSMPTTRARPNPTRRQTEVLPSSSAPASATPRATKRPRLSMPEESTHPSTSQDPLDQRSKFFPSPAKKPKRRTELWSDSSIEEAMLNLPEHGVSSLSSTKSTKGISIFEDGANTLTPRHDDHQIMSTETSQSTSIETSFDSMEQAGAATQTPASSAGTGVTDTSQPPATKPSRPRLSGLAARFSYFSQEVVPTLSSTKSTKPADEGSLVKKSMRDSGVGLGQAPTDKAKIASKDASGSKKVPLPTAQISTRRRLPIPRDLPPSSMIAMHGSEDFLVPESSEAEEGEERGSSLHTGLSFDVSRFAFIP